MFLNLAPFESLPIYTMNEENQIRKFLETNRKMEPVIQVFIKNELGEVVAEVEKVLSVRAKNKIS